MKESAEDAGEQTKHARHQKAQEEYRERQSNREGWGHAAFFGPATAIENIKSEWENYKRAHPELWIEEPEPES